MKHISILVLKGAILGSIEGPRQLFAQVNNFFTDRGERPLYKVQLVGLIKETPLSGGLFTVHSDLLIQDVKKTDLIIIPAMDGDLKNAIEMNSEFLPWIVKHYKTGAEVASLCMGAFLLAATGLLNGRKCATHWMAANEFRKMFPDVNLVAEKIITDESGIYSSGGAYSYLNLILYLIEKYAGRDIAILCSKVFAIEIERYSQSAFAIFQGQKEHGDKPIKNAQEFIENNFQDKITVDQLATMSILGRRSFERRFKKATSDTVTKYIQRVKVEAAKKSFETSKKNIYEVMYDVGYSDDKSFRTIFKKITGLSPVDYRNKYNYEGMYL
ncbi:MAG: helix-turn-helix domain-containing protein [Bacteroidota bacterium]|nr:helix-turn-helix domain-containing protein [Bacteroidota bacterium]